MSGQVELVALIDVLLGVFWRTLDHDEQGNIRSQHEESDLTPKSGRSLL